MRVFIVMALTIFTGFGCLGCLDSSESKTYERESNMADALLGEQKLERLESEIIYPSNLSIQLKKQSSLIKNYEVNGDCFYWSQKLTKNVHLHRMKCKLTEISGSVEDEILLAFVNKKLVGYCARSSQAHAVACLPIDPSSTGLGIRRFNSQGFDIGRDQVSIPFAKQWSK